ncbi:adenosylhomocysteinase [Streptomyces cucumeris]|uniref:adenosylhomocysteinase n=1 Tax=Streptomyces cucumeris TaxID=2962890 RepID=UPI0020C86170|nr:adenosylhomocysteinase [Streptomyces sp. NEAU-Y11]MCP9206548.1 adenosylhomocysteinase [Streptomyces sp. NEAU-Y11]
MTSSTDTVTSADTATATREDFAVADIGLAAAGRRAISLAEHEMPGLMALRAEYGAQRPLSGVRVTGFLHLTVQTAVLIETLIALGARVRWAGSHQDSAQDEAAAALAAGPHTVPVFGWKGQSREELWWCADRALSWEDGGGPDMLLDDGAGMTLLIHHGVAHEAGRDLTASVPALPPEAARLVRKRGAADPGHWSRTAGRVRGVSEETTTGARLLHQLADAEALLFPAISVNDSVTKSKFDNRYGCRHSLVDGLNRATDTLIAGKLAVVCGYGDVGKGCAEALRAQGARVVVTEIDPICALQAAMDGYQVAALERFLEEADIVITATGAPRVVTAGHMSRMKHQAIVGNMGHLDAEIDVAGLQGCGTAHRVPIKPQVDEWVFDDGHAVILLSEGRLLNLGNATGHPSFVMSSSFTNQVLAQLHLATAVRPTAVSTLPKVLDEKVARLHLGHLRMELTTLSEEQSQHQGIPVEGPYKPDHYRY